MKWKAQLKGESVIIGETAFQMSRIICTQFLYIFHDVVMSPQMTNYTAQH